MPYIQKHDAFLLKNHGALTVGNTLLRACFTMEEVEFNAKINLYARQIGAGINSRIDEIPCAELEKLMELRKKMGLPGKHPGCKTCPNLGTSNCRCKDNAPAGHTCNCGTHSASADNDLVAEITKKVLAALGR
jgi:L-fuculose-phosphate aldolase